MKILIVSEMSVPYAVGGGEVRYGLLARELARRGHNVTWLSMRQRQSPDEEVIEGVRHLHRGPRIQDPPSRPVGAVAAAGAARRARGLPPLRAAVVGGGPLGDEMQARAGSLGLVPPGAAASTSPVPSGTPPEPPAATVEFCGSLADHAAVIGRIKSAGALVFPSTREGFGLVLAEAMACGTPCVAYDVPAVREVLADGEAGVLVTPRDVAGLAAAIGGLLEDSAEREHFIAAGRLLVGERYTAGRFAERIEAVYRDWGYAPDYVRAMWMMTTADVADDFVIATGETRSVREFVERAAAVAGFEIAWEGAGPAEAGYDRATGRRLVAVEPRFFRPLDHSSICGSAAKAKAVLGWEPTVGFDRLVEIMMEGDLGQA
jgi:hypothetical protein